jgi:hypothetical protein
LNGRWRFSFDPQNVGEQMRWYHLSHPVVAEHTGEVSYSVEDPFVNEIVVPFPWESRASGIGDSTYKGAAWYQRSIEVPREWAAPGPGRTGVTWRRHPYLCFGAVDWSAKVWVNGRFVAEHEGGYTPFVVDLSRHVRPGVPATLTVRAWDVCDADTPLGKQTAEWYTHSSGIWQPVWLEGRPAAFLSRLHVTPHLEHSHATFSVTVETPRNPDAGECRLTIESDDGFFPTVERTIEVRAGRGDASIDVHVPRPRPWSPEDPHLYDCTLTLTPLAEGQDERPAAPGRTRDELPSVVPSAPGHSTFVAENVPDTVRTYFGLRSIATGRWDHRPYEFVLLNGAPVYLRGALDQGFHPEGLHAYPSDAAIRADIEAAKALGLNMLRCHIKVNDPRYYYWCDKLGMLVLYDLPSVSIYTPKARANWELTLRAAVERDYSHPSIIAWVLFNETWGLEEHRRPEGWGWVKDMYYLAKQLDPTRLVEDNSTYLWDHVTTDINTWHFYLGDYDRARRHVENVVSQTFEGSPYHFVGGVYGDVQGAEAYRQGTQPLLNSEYGGVSAWDGDRDISYPFKFLTTELRRHDMICGYVYTELADVEWEHNGLLNYDRTPKEFGYDAFVPGMGVADLNGPDFVGLDCPPCQTLRPGSEFLAPAFVSHWSARPLTGTRLRWRVTAIDRLGETRVVVERERSVEPRHYGVTDVGDVAAPLPDEPCLVTVALWLEDGDGTVRARNYVNVDVFEGDRDGQSRWSRVEQAVERVPGGYALRFLPGDYAASNWLEPRLGPRGSKFGASGPGWVDYALTLPGALDPAAVTRLRLRFEAGARTAKHRIDWKEPRRVLSSDYPQTEQRKIPSDIVVWVNGLRLGAVHLPDDPADARGVLSAHNSENWESSSYGYLTTLEADPALTRRILAAAPDGRLMVRIEVPGSRRERERAAGAQGGLNLYGARMGAYPLDPTLFLDLAEA